MAPRPLTVVQMLPALDGGGVEKGTLEVGRYLVQHGGKPVSRKTILEKVWNLHEDTDTRAIDNFIVRLRRYIEEDSARPKHLLTVRGVGYRFIAEPAAETKTSER